MTAGIVTFRRSRTGERERNADSLTPKETIRRTVTNLDMSTGLEVLGAADSSSVDVEGLEITPLPQRHLALLRQFQPGDEGRSPAGAPQQGTAGRIVGVRGFNRQQLCERRAA
jgi:hypothetical protein